MKAFVLLVVVSFIFFELASSQTTQSPTTSSNNASARFLGNLGFGTPGVGSLSYLDPSLLLLSQVLSQNISLNCLYLLSTLFSQTGSHFPVSNLQSTIQTYNPQTVTIQQVQPLFRDTARQRALPLVLSGCNFFGESTSSLLSFLYFILLSGNTPTSPVTCYNSRPIYGGNNYCSPSCLSHQVCEYGSINNAFGYVQQGCRCVTRQLQCSIHTNYGVPYDSRRHCRYCQSFQTCRPSYNSYNQPICECLPKYRPTLPPPPPLTCSNYYSNPLNPIALPDYSRYCYPACTSSQDCVAQTYSNVRSCVCVQKPTLPPVISTCSNYYLTTFSGFGGHPGRNRYCYPSCQRHEECVSRFTLFRRTCTCVARSCNDCVGAPICQVVIPTGAECFCPNTVGPRQYCTL